MKLQQVCLEKDWKPRFFCENFIETKHVPETVEFLNSKIEQLKNPDKVHDFYCWALAEQEIKNKFKKNASKTDFLGSSVDDHEIPWSFIRMVYEH